MTIPKKAVVTGGAGFIGTHLVRALLSQGYEVHVVDTFVGGRFPERISEAATYHEVDVRDTDQLTNIFAGTAYVFHTAALPRVQYSLEFPQRTNDVNVSGTLSALEAGRQAKVQRFVYSASSSAYGDQPVMPLREDMPSNPKSPYALQKYIGELYSRMYAEAYGLPTVSLRYFNVYGPGADPNGAYALVIAKFIEQRKNNQPLTIAGDGTNTRDYTHVRDIVRANILAATSSSVGAGEVFNIGAGNNRSVNEVAKSIGGAVTYGEARNEPSHTLADTSKARQILDWKPEVTFEEGIAELKHAAGIL